MSTEIEKLLNEYSNWLKDKTILKNIAKDWVEVTTPFLDRHNDYIQFYIRQEGKDFIFTDDGFILNDLMDSGCDIDTPKRSQILKTTLLGFGVDMVGNALTIKSTKDMFSLKKHNYIQAMLAVNDLFYLSQSTVRSLFFEDVEQWLEISDIRATPKVKFTGKSGYDHMFDFVIPKSRTQPERIIQTINNPRKESAESLVFKWLDTKDTRPQNSLLYAFLNDMNEEIPSTIITAFENYQTIPVPWSQKDSYKLPLAE